MKKFFTAFFLGTITWFVIMMCLFYITKRNHIGGQPEEFFMVLFSIIIGLIVFLKMNKNNYNFISSTTNKVISKKEELSAVIVNKDTEFYAIAEKEINENFIDQGLWSKALVKAKGDEKLRKVEYMKLRVIQLKQEKNKRK